MVVNSSIGEAPSSHDDVRGAVVMHNSGRAAKLKRRRVMGGN